MFGHRSSHGICLPISLGILWMAILKHHSKLIEDHRQVKLSKIFSSAMLSQNYSFKVFFRDFHKKTSLILSLHDIHEVMFCKERLHHWNSYHHYELQKSYLILFLSYFIFFCYSTMSKVMDFTPGFNCQAIGPMFFLLFIMVA